MDGGGSQQRLQQPTANSQLASLIRPEQVARLPQLNDVQKQQYTVGVRKFWEILNGAQQGDPRYNDAYNKLVQTSQTLMNGMKNFQMQQKMRAQQQQQQVVAQQAAARQGGQQGGAQTSGVAFSALSEDIQNKVNAKPFILPPQMSVGSRAAEDWLREAKARFGQALQRMSVARQKKAEFERQAAQRTQIGNPLNPAEQENYNTKIAQCNKAINESSNFMEKFSQQQAEFRNQNPQAMFSQGQAGGEATAEQPAVTANSASNVQPVPSGPPAHSIATAVSAAANARNQQAGATQPGQAGSPTANAPVNLMQANSSATPTKTEGAQPFTQQPPHPTDTGAAGPRPVSHGTNVVPPSALSQHPSQSSIHNLPLNASISGARPNTAQAITKNLQVTEPKPVQMPPSRPTLNGGPGVGLPGQLGQPAITTLPGYVLESGDGEGLLSKKKLYELVREVCGSGPGEQMTPEAEEIFLMVADDFVDEIVTMSSRMAKLRGSTTLEPRDVQMVLERQFNIRVPGYSTDEIRIAKRVQPAPGWTMKMGAVQASKVTGGIGGSKD